MSECAQCGKKMASGFFAHFNDYPSKDDPSVCAECNFSNFNPTGLSKEDASEAARVNEMGAAGFSIP